MIYVTQIQYLRIDTNEKEAHTNKSMKFFLNTFKTAKSATNHKESVTEASQQDKPRKATRACTELSTLDKAHQLPYILNKTVKIKSLFNVGYIITHTGKFT